MDSNNQQPDISGFIKEARASGTSDSDIYSYLKQKGVMNSANQSPTPDVEDSGTSNFIATMLARPLQALQSAGELLGSNQGELTKLSAQNTHGMQSVERLIQQKKAQGLDTSHLEKTLSDIQGTPDYAAQEQQNQANYQPSSGGIVAPAPQNFSDVQKDVGRAVQTVALGLGPVAGGASFGLGSSLEQGNDLFSGQTAFQTVLGGAAGKVLGLIGEPIMNAAGKVISKITPDFLSNIASQGSKAIEDFAASHDILPQFASDAVNSGAKAIKDVTNKYIDTPIDEGINKAGELISSAKDNISNLGKQPFNEVYTQHAQNQKALNNSFNQNTIKIGENQVTPIDTIEKYENTPKVSKNSKLDMTEVMEEAKNNSKAATKIVNEKVANIDSGQNAVISKQAIMDDALKTASEDTNIVRTASLPSVQSQIKQIFNDYSIEGDNITAKQINEFRKGANTASQAYYAAQSSAATAGTIPKEVADRSQAFAVLGDTFRQKLIDLDPTIDSALTQSRVQNAALKYATKAHLSSVNINPVTRSVVDAGGAAIGGVVGSTAGPVGTIAGIGIGGGIAEKTQSMLLKRVFEKAIKN
jgi:hypothetical protein